MRKRLIPFLLAFSMAVTSLCPFDLGAVAKAATVVDGITYDYDEDESGNAINVRITNLAGKSVVNIPSEIDGKTVVSIGVDGRRIIADGAISAVTIPSTVTEIHEKAFYNTSISEIYIPSSVTMVGEDAFGACSCLEKAELDGNAQYAKAFRDDENLVDIIIGEGVEILSGDLLDVTNNSHVNQEERRFYFGNPSTKIKIVSEKSGDFSYSAERPVEITGAEGSFALEDNGSTFINNATGLGFQGFECERIDGKDFLETGEIFSNQINSLVFNISESGLNTKKSALGICSNTKIPKVNVAFKDNLKLYMRLPKRLKKVTDTYYFDDSSQKVLGDGYYLFAGNKELLNWDNADYKYTERLNQEIALNNKVILCSDKIRKGLPNRNDSPCYLFDDLNKVFQDGDLFLISFPSNYVNYEEFWDGYSYQDISEYFDLKSQKIDVNSLTEISLSNLYKQNIQFVTGEQNVYAIRVNFSELLYDSFLSGRIHASNVVNRNDTSCYPDDEFATAEVKYIAYPNDDITLNQSFDASSIKRAVDAKLSEAYPSIESAGDMKIYVHKGEVANDTSSAYTYPEYLMDNQPECATNGTDADGNAISNCSIEEIDDITVPYIKSRNHKVSFDTDGGNVISEEADVDYKDTYGKLPTPVKEGSIFLGWTTESGEIVTEDSIVSTKDDEVLHALWATNEDARLVYFDANGGSCTVNSRTVYKNGIYGSLPVPVKSGYNFKGWYTEDGKEIKAKDRVNFEGDQTLIAKYSPASYTLSLDANGGELDVESINVFYDAKMDNLPTPVKSGYNFAGWTIDGRYVDKDTVWNYFSNRTARAEWEETRTDDGSNEDNGGNENNGGNEDNTSEDNNNTSEDNKNDSDNKDDSNGNTDNKNDQNQNGNEDNEKQDIPFKNLSPGGEMEIDETVRLTFPDTVKPVDNTDDSVARIENGVLVIGKDGETDITIENNGFTYVYHIVVKDGKATITLISKTQNEKAPEAGESVTIDTDDEFVLSDKDANTSSDDESVAYIKDGVLIVGKDGETDILVKDGDRVITYHIVVKDGKAIITTKDSYKIVPEDEELTVEIDESVSLGTKDVEVESNTDDAVARVEDGKIIFLGKDGETYLTIKDGDRTSIYHVVVKDGKASIELVSTTTDDVTKTFDTKTIGESLTFEPLETVVVAKGEYSVLENTDETIATIVGGRVVLTGKKGETKLTIYNNAEKSSFIYAIEVSDKGKITLLRVRLGNLSNVQTDDSGKTTDTPEVKDYVTTGGITYKLSGNSAYVSKCTKNSGSVKIPDSVKIAGKTVKVTKIAKNVFKGKKITSVTISGNVKTIDVNAFSGCKKLKKITVKGKSVKFGKNCFKGIYKKATIKCNKALRKKVMKKSVGFVKTMKVK